MQLSEFIVIGCGEENGEVVVSDASMNVLEGGVDGGKI